MKLYISYIDEKSNDWINIAAIALRPNNELFPDGPVSSDFGLLKEHVTIPTGECLLFSVAYSPGNRGVSIGVEKEETTILDVGGFKSKESTFDPNVMFLTPEGSHVNIMVGP